MDEQQNGSARIKHSEAPLSLDRRDFFRRVGGGVVVFFTLDTSAALYGQESPGRGYPSDFNAYLRIAEDGRVTVFSGKIEMGQGVMTSLAQMAADELGVLLGSIDMIMGDTESCPSDMGTFGSMTTRFFGPAVRAAAAEARAVLLELASEHLKAPKDQLRVENGVVFAGTDKKWQVSYGQLAKGQKIVRKLNSKAVTKALAEFKLMGQSTHRLDALAKVSGKARYAGDMRLPDMLYARVLRLPAHGAMLRKADTSAAEKLPGVIVVNQEGLVAVLHQDPYAAEKALESIKADFDIPAPTVDHDSIFDRLVQGAPPAAERELKGDLAAGEKAAATLIESRFLNAYVAHAPIETHTALAQVEAGKATIWPSTQTPFPNRQEIARALNFPLENVRVITPYVGGGFGGKAGSALMAIEAAKLSKITGKPVQVAFSRAEEFFYDNFRPAAVIRIKSGMDSAGKLLLWNYNVYAAGSRGSEQFYDVPNNIIRVYGEWGRDTSKVHPFGIGPWRAPAANSNSFARESQIDIMASRARVDPLEFRLNNTSSKRMRKVLETVAEKFGWKPAVSPSGRGLGIACGIDAGTYVAEIAEVQVDKASGQVQVKRVVCAQDMGMVINPEGARMQMEGCITMGLGYTLAEEVRFKGGQILDRNFDTYELPRFSWLPEIETVFVKNDELAPQGGGEPAIIGMGALVANAIFDATGARLYRLPMTPARIKEALSRAAQV